MVYISQYLHTWIIYTLKTTVIDIYLYFTHMEHTQQNGMYIDPSGIQTWDLLIHPNWIWIDSLAHSATTADLHITLNYSNTQQYKLASDIYQKMKPYL